jgi:lipopolysaccharide transport system permease protein
LNRFFSFLFDIYRFREILWDLTKRDIKNRYLGSYLGFFWAFIQPLINLALLWFVFTYGLKARPESEVPFVLWLMAGLIPWNFISESILGSTNSILENSFLVKKVVFRVSLLPIVKVMSASLVISFSFLFCYSCFDFEWIAHYIHSLQIPYYFGLTVFFVLGLSWITSSVIIFFRDLGQIIAIGIQFAFWLTPIFWSYKAIPEKYLYLLSLNPFFYITEGYRDALINHVWFWNKSLSSFFFLALTAISISHRKYSI